MPSATTEAPARERLAELDRRIAQHSGRFLVLTHDNPDPDALAAAALLTKLLARRFRLRVTAAYGGLIGRAENREMVRSLKLKLSHLRHLSWSSYQSFALVDTQPRTGNNQLPDLRVPELVFDHHPLRKATTAGFLDVRPDYGATASILAEYLEAAEIDLTAAEATALVYAIRSETQDFGREFSPRDKELYDRYLPRVDKRALGRIQNARLPLSYFANLRQALEGLLTVGRLVVSHLGTVEQPDIVPEVADLLVRLEGKTWSLCTGRFGDRVYLSLRTTNPRADAGGIMRRLVGRKGKGGGHGMTAGGWVPITVGYAQDPGSLQQQLGRRLATALHQNPDKLAPVPLTAAAEKTRNGGPGRS